MSLQGCNVAHILGLYKMTSKSGLAFSLSAAGSVADVVLWAIARLQMRMYASATFQKWVFFFFYFFFFFFFLQLIAINSMSWSRQPFPHNMNDCAAVMRTYGSTNRPYH